ncbi:MAG: pyridoxal-dependent decarboxylase [Planctomycetota bacterium]
MNAAFDPERFRREGRAVVDWLADYWATLADRPVSLPVEPGAVRRQLPAAAPDTPEPLAAVLADLDRVILPALTHWQHPGFFAYFPASTAPPSILGELLAAGLGVQGMLWSTSPACTELETHVLDWLADLLGLPARLTSRGPGGGVILDSASSGVLVALLAARERATAGITNGAGMAATPAPLTVYASADAHSCVEKALCIAGLGRGALRRIAVAADGGLDAAALSDRLAADAAAGCRPCLVVATVGTTARGGIDPVSAIAAAAARHGAWVHVDAAWAGTAALCPEWRADLVAGTDAIDSWGTNPHKWLQVNFDCHCLWLADRAPVVRALSVKPEYLRNAATESGAVIDYSDWQVPLGRRFRALKLWLTLRLTGAEALRGRIRDHVHWAGWFAERVAADDRLVLLCPPSLALVCFAAAGGDAATTILLEQINANGRVLMSQARVAGRTAIRLAVGSPTTRREHVEGAWDTVVAGLSQMPDGAPDRPG